MFNPVEACTWRIESLLERCKNENSEYFLTEAYKTFLNRLPEPSVLHSSKSGQNTDRRAILTRIINSSEYLAGNDYVQSLLAHSNHLISCANWGQAQSVLGSLIENRLRFPEIRKNSALMSLMGILDSAADIYKKMALCSRMLGHLEEAFSYYNKALEINSNDPEIKLALEDMKVNHREALEQSQD